MKESKKQIVIIHGGSTYDSYRQYLNTLKKKTFEKDRMMQRKWRDGVAQKLGHSYEVLTPTMPNPHNAKYLEWKIWFKKIEPFLKNGVVLVGHSLGGIFLAKYLAENTFSKKVRATFLIATPFDTTGSEETLADFALPQCLDRFEKQGGEVFLYHSTDDSVVPFSHLKKYQNALPRAQVLIFKNRDHFNQSSFPELTANIVSMYT